MYIVIKSAYLPEFGPGRQFGSHQATASCARAQVQKVEGFGEGEVAALEQMRDSVRVVAQDGEAVNYEADFLQHHDLAGQRLGHFLAFEMIWADGRAVEHGIELGEKLLLSTAVVDTGFLSLAVGRPLAPAPWWQEWYRAGARCKVRKEVMPGAMCGIIGRNRNICKH